MGCIRGFLIVQFSKNCTPFYVASCKLIGNEVRFPGKGTGKRVKGLFSGPFIPGKHASSLAV